MPPPRSRSAPTSHQVISKQLRALILARGTTAYSLGQQAGIDPGIVQRFLNEERDIRLDSLDRLADVLGLRLVEGSRGRGRPAQANRAGTPARKPHPGRNAGAPESGPPGDPPEAENGPPADIPPPDPAEDIIAPPWPDEAATSAEDQADDDQPGLGPLTGEEPADDPGSCWWQPSAPEDDPPADCDE